MSTSFRQHLLAYDNFLLDVGDTLVHITEPFSVYTPRGLGYVWDLVKPALDREVFVEQALAMRNALRKVAHVSHLEPSIFDFFDLVFTSLSIPFDQALLQSSAEAFVESELSITETYGDVIPFLDFLRAEGKRALIASNNYAVPHVDAILDRFGFRPYMDGIYVSGGIRYRKPHKGFIDTILREEGLDPSKTIMVGDKAHLDILAANRSGVDSVYLVRDEVKAAKQPIGPGMEATFRVGSLELDVETGPRG